MKDNESVINGRVTGIKQTSMHTITMFFEGGDIEVCQLSQHNITTLMSRMSGDGLLFRINDGVIRKRAWVHFLEPKSGVDGPAIVTGSRFDPVVMGGKLDVPVKHKEDTQDDLRKGYGASALQEHWNGQTSEYTEPASIV